MLLFWVFIVGVTVATASRESRSQRTLQANGGLSVSANDTKRETLESRNQQIGIRRSVHEPYEPCFKPFFVNNQPPSGFRQDLTDIRYICQQISMHQETYYATMFDQSEGIAVYSAYVITPQMANNFGAVPRPLGQGPWKEEPGITRQGTRQLYQGQAPFQIGHLVPAETFSFAQENMDSTFKFTNAVPQYGGFNGGQWMQYERRIRHYAANVCGPANGDLYLLTGTSRIQYNPQALPPAPPAVQQPVNVFPPLNPAIAIPNSMWTAGCCVAAPNAVQGFAVIGNNVANNLQIHMSKVTVVQLENLLRVGVAGFGGQTIDLFPGNQACSNPANDVAALPLPQAPPPPPGR